MIRTTLKLVLPLAVSVIIVSLFYGFYQVRLEQRNLRNDLLHRSAVFAENLQENLESTPTRATDRNLGHFVDKYGQREHLLGVAVYDNSGHSIALTKDLPETFSSQPSVAAQAAKTNKGANEFRDVDGGPLHLYAVPLHHDRDITGSLLVISAQAIFRRGFGTPSAIRFLSTLVQTLLITGLALFWSAGRSLRR